MGSLPSARGEEMNFSLTGRPCFLCSSVLEALLKAVPGQDHSGGTPEIAGESGAFTYPLVN